MSKSQQLLSANDSLKFGILSDKFPCPVHVFTYQYVYKLVKKGIAVQIFRLKQGNVNKSWGDEQGKMVSVLNQVVNLPTYRNRVESLSQFMLRAIPWYLSADTRRFMQRMYLDCKSARSTLRAVGRFYPIIQSSISLLSIESSFLGRIFHDFLRNFNGHVIISLRGADVYIKPYVSLQWQTWLRKVGTCDHIWFHCVSDYVRNQATLLGIPSKKSFVVRQGIDPVDFASKAALQFANQVRIISVGRLVWEKGYTYALQAISYLLNRGYDIVYHIIGEGPARDELMYYINELNLKERVFLNGELPFVEVRRRLLNADIFLQPSIIEAFGRSLVEAQASGLPVVATKVGGIPEVVLNGKTGLLVNMSDSRALADALEELIKNPKRARRFGTNGRERVLQEFTLDKEIAAVFGIYQSLIKNSALY